MKGFLGALVGHGFGVIAGRYVRKNKMKPTNPNADTCVEEQKQDLSHFPANPLVGHPDLTH